jgi:predicted dehydrogenase
MPYSSESTYAQAAASAHPPRPKSPRPIIILGAGGIVRAAHLPAYAKAGFPVIAVADPVPGKAAELLTPGVRAFHSVTDAVAFAPPDAVFDIAVPAAQLLEILPLLPRGSAVLMQKPMGDTLAEARAIHELCAANGLTAAVNFQLRYAPNNLGAVALAQAGLLGELHDMEVSVRTHTPWELWTFLAKAPRLEILYHSIHYLDLARAWFGDPLGVKAVTVRNPETAALAPTKSVLLLDYGDHRRVFLATTHTHHFAETQQSYVQWEGTAGAIRMCMGVNLDYPTGKPDTLAFALRSNVDAGWQDVPLSGNWFPEAFMGSMGVLQAYVEGSVADLPISAASALRTMALVEAAYRSANSAGEPLEI